MAKTISMEVNGKPQQVVVDDPDMPLLYALRNDLGLLWFVELDADMPPRIQALPLGLDYCFTRVASPEESEWIAQRLRALCAPFGTAVGFSDGLIDVRAAD